MSHMNPCEKIPCEQTMEIWQNDGWKETQENVFGAKNQEICAIASSPLPTIVRTLITKYEEP